MSNRQELLTPVGRLVQGSLYTGQTTDAENRPLIYKTGPNINQPRTDYFFAIAIAKGNEKHWTETEWGKIIYATGHAGFPNGQANSPTFAWKIKDGDSNIPNKAGKKPCDCEGFPGHWILNFSSGFAPAIYNADGSQQILEKDAVNLGDYVQVYGSVADNESAQQPGVYLNHQIVAFAGYGKRIFAYTDPKTVGFGKAPLPVGASATPLAQGFNPAPAMVEPPVYNVQNLPSGITAPVPHYGILTPPIPVQKTLTAKAQGATYDQMIGAGWTDALLIQHGYMIG